MSARKRFYLRHRINGIGLMSQNSILFGEIKRVLSGYLDHFVISLFEYAIPGDSNNRLIEMRILENMADYEVKGMLNRVLDGASYDAVFDSEKEKPLSKDEIKAISLGEIIDQPIADLIMHPVSSADDAMSRLKAYVSSGASGGAVWGGIIP